MFHVSDIFIFLVALLHFGFMVLETFLWQSNFAKKRFGMTNEVAAITANLAKNQGVYNLFLSAGLIFAQFYRGQDVYNPLVLFFLGCVIVAGIVGALTVSSRIFFIQAVPAIIAAILLLVGM
jgi:putative membrane protein